MIGGIPGIGEKPYYAPGLWRPDARCPIPNICFALLPCEFGSRNIRDWRSGLSAALPTQITWNGDGLYNTTVAWFACRPPSPMVCGSSHTWIARFKYSSVSADGQYLFDQASPRCIIAIQCSGISPATIGVYNGAWIEGPQLPGDWHTLAWVEDGNKAVVRFYIDGTVAGSMPITPISLAGGTQNWFHRYADNSGKLGLTGWLQWVQVFYSALTDAQIAAQYRDPFMWLRSPSNRFYSIPSGAARLPRHLFTPVAGGA